MNNLWNVQIAKLSTLLVTLLIHILVIFLVVQFNSPSEKYHEDTSVTTPPIYLPADVKKQHSVIAVEPSSAFSISPINHLQKVPEFDIEDKEALQDSHTSSDFEDRIPKANNNAFGNVFDPRLRKALRENGTGLPQFSKKELNTWSDPNGTQRLEVGDGECITSMQGASGEKGTRWSSSRVKCGKNEGERMMDRLNRSLNKK